MRLIGLATLFIWASQAAWASVTHLDDPLCRAHLLQWQTTRNLIEGQSIAIRGNKVYLGNNQYSLFEASFHPKLQTIVYHHKDGRVPGKINYGAKHGEVAPKLHLAVIHGGGGMKSQGGSWLNFMNIMMSTKSKKGSLADTLKGLPTWLPTVSESIDLPGYGAGRHLDDYVTAKAQIAYLIEWFEDMKKASGGLPLVAIARSASTGLMPAIAHMRPDLLAGMILIGPMHPTVGLKENERLAYEHAEQTGEYKIGEEAERLAWIRSQAEAGNLIIPGDAEGDLGARISTVNSMIDTLGGFPATGLRERLAWLSNMQSLGLIGATPDQIAFLDKLGSLPGGSNDQRRSWIEEKIRRDEFVPNLRGLEVLFGWNKDMGAADSGPLNWHRNRSPFNGIPTYVVWGESDWQVPHSVRFAYRWHTQRARQFQPLTRYGSWKGVGHDVVAVAHKSMPNEGKDTVVDVYTHVYDFLNAVNERQEQIAAARAVEEPATTSP
ncbi:MAG: alpha/beta fold hydrolase [Bdellovibrionales bacterium]|nr:alpha/beta fold hydrolase [Bdellovibrionales bacterium]MCB0417535.1 alpha/beta fold hydrolase [Bdellovibrionales bacterium]MCB9254769.1 alpha/beta fold hydrolase [Pseudobdellovibrionaceae bacterium]